MKITKPVANFYNFLKSKGCTNTSFIIDKILEATKFNRIIFKNYYGKGQFVDFFSEVDEGNF